MVGRIVSFLWYQYVKVTTWVGCHCLYRISVFGLENIPADGPLLFLSNHQSYLDPILAQCTQSRTLHFVARDSLFRNRLFAAMIRNLNAMPIKRGETDMAAMRLLIGVLKEGNAVCLYPEGTRTKDGKIAAIKPGLSLLSRRSGAKALPVVLDGVFESWPRDRKFPKLGVKIGIMFGEPFDADEIKSLGDKGFAEVFTGRLREIQSELRKKMGREPFDYEGVEDEHD